MKIEGPLYKLKINEKYNPKDYSKIWQLNLSSVSLILSNLLTLLLAIINNWSIFTLMWIYVFQNIIIGLFNYKKILSVEQFSSAGIKINGLEVKNNEDTKRKIAKIFLSSFMFFNMIYIFFIIFFTFFTTKLFESGLTLSNVFYQENYWLIIISVISFLIHHTFSFYYNSKNDLKKKDIRELVNEPYLRILPMHLTIIFGGFLIVFTQGKFPLVLMMFIVLKSLVDLLMHQIEHKSSYKK